MKRAGKTESDRKCRCRLQPTSAFGADIQRCPSCSALWMNGGGIHRLRKQMHDGQWNKELGWADLEALLGGKQPSQT